MGGCIGKSRDVVEHWSTADRGNERSGSLGRWYVILTRHVIFNDPAIRSHRSLRSPEEIGSCSRIP